MTSVNVEHNMELVANWKINDCKVTFDGNGGSCTLENKSVSLDEKYGVLPEARRSGYTFAGWYTSKDSGSRVTEYTQVQTTEAHTLYAHWTANVYAVAFNANGGNCSTKNVQVTYDSTYGTLPVPERTEYTFDGWYTESVGGIQITNASIVNLAADQTLYAHWTEYKTMYMYYHYTSGVYGQYAVCPNSGKTGSYKWNVNNVYREVLLLNEPLTKNAVMQHSSSTTCKNDGCVDESWKEYSYHDRNYETNKVVWYRQQEVRVPASTEEGVKREN